MVKELRRVNRNTRIFNVRGRGRWQILKRNSFDELYEGLDTMEGEEYLYHLASQRDLTGGCTAGKGE